MPNHNIHNLRHLAAVFLNVRCYIMLFTWTKTGKLAIYQHMPFDKSDWKKNKHPIQFIWCKQIIYSNCHTEPILICLKALYACTFFITIQLWHLQLRCGGNCIYCMAFMHMCSISHWRSLHMEITIDQIDLRCTDIPRNILREIRSTTAELLTSIIIYSALLSECHSHLRSNACFSVEMQKGKDLH